jgi:hypothetical protein
LNGVLFEHFRRDFFWNFCWSLYSCFFLELCDVWAFSSRFFLRNLETGSKKIQMTQFKKKLWKS